MALSLGTILRQTNVSSNASSSVFGAELPATMLEAFLPGYGVLSKIMLQRFGLDISMVVTAAVLLAAIGTFMRYLHTYSWQLFARIFLCTIYVDAEDDMFHSVLKWIASQPVGKNARAAKAVTQTGSSWDDASTQSGEDITAIEASVNEHGFFSFSRWQARVPPRYEAYFGTQHRFVWKGKLFIIERQKKETSKVKLTWGHSEDDERLSLQCVGRTTEAIRDFLGFIKLWSVERENHTTTVRHPTPKERGARSGAWTKVSTRPSRPMSTVVLDKNQKQRVIDDASEFLHPSAPRWYSNRGIPYRRGYLLYGAPGTGKTSLSFALAGIFGLEIYVISLNDSLMNDSDLAYLFYTLPKRCIVLLEDIDTAGLTQDRRPVADDVADEKKPSESIEKSAIESRRHDDQLVGNNATKDQVHALSNGSQLEAVPKSPPESFSVSDLTKVLKDLLFELKGSNQEPKKPRQRTTKKPDGSDDNAPKQGISLSGLLNAIDGVASHEGRLLIMTTNHPENLDEALIRPGRVDLKVGFNLASQEQVRDLFIRMYGSDDITTSTEQNETSRKEKDEEAALSLKRLGQEFASRIPPGRFSPAEIQGFFLMRKKDPQQALEDVEDWKSEQLALKSAASD